MAKPIELGVTVAAIVLSVFLSEFLIHKYLYAQPPTQVAAIAKPKPSAPAKIEWAAGSKTLILALQTSCNFCNESAPFYKTPDG